MKFGAHVSIAGGIDKAPSNANQIKAEVFQIFSRSPRGGKAPELTKELITDFKSEMKKYSIDEAYIHTPYYINLASTNSRIRDGSIEVIREELERATILGLPYIMTHLGSANDLPRHQAVKQVSEGINEIMKGYKGSAMFLLENSAGSGKVIGDKFEELAEIINKLPTWYKEKVGVCFDTCHAFATGYDLRNKKAIDEVLKEFNKHLDLKNLKLIHLNDSKTELGKQVDRHEHIGQGKIGLKGFKELINHPQLENINMILETPIDELGDHEANLKLIKKIRKQ